MKENLYVLSHLKIKDKLNNKLMKKFINISELSKILNLVIKKQKNL